MFFNIETAHVGIAVDFCPFKSSGLDAAGVSHPNSLYVFGSEEIEAATARFFAGTEYRDAPLVEDGGNDQSSGGSCCREDAVCDAMPGLRRPCTCGFNLIQRAQVPVGIQVAWDERCRARSRSPIQAGSRAQVWGFSEAIDDFVGDGADLAAVGLDGQVRDLPVQGLAHFHQRLEHRAGVVSFE